MELLKAFGRFWYDFLIGDDWKIAAGVVVALAVLVTMMLTTSLGDTALTLGGGALVVAAFVASLALDLRSRRG